MVQTVSRFIDVPVRRSEETFREAAMNGLSQSQRSLPCRFFYDEIGSVLFEQICDLPEYYPTRTERAIISAHADAMLAATGASQLTLVELGSGNSCKTRLLIEAALRRQRRLHYLPIDISGEFLRASAAMLAAEYPRLDLTAIAAEYRDALTALPTPDTPRLFLFLGGNIGNFTADEATSLLCDLRIQMRPEDRLLVGHDRIKPIALLEAAYNDAAGVTAAFNKNLLARINRELGADFDLNQWEHHAPFVPERSRIEMWLISRCDQVVTFGDNEEFAFRRGEVIHTENSHKYTPESFMQLAGAAGLTVERTWSDVDAWFSVTLLRPGVDQKIGGDMPW